MKKIAILSISLMYMQGFAMEVDDQNKNTSYLQVINEAPQSVLVKFKISGNGTLEQYMVKSDETMRCSQTLNELLRQNRQFENRYIKIKDDQNNTLFRGHPSFREIRGRDQSFSIILSLQKEGTTLPGKGKHKWGSLSCVIEKIEKGDFEKTSKK